MLTAGAAFVASVTAFCAGTVTASGRAPQAGWTAAADTRLLPLGALVVIEGLGVRRIDDRGSKVKGFVLDVYLGQDCDKAKRFGRQRRGVSVLAVPSDFLPGRQPGGSVRTPSSEVGCPHRLDPREPVCSPTTGESSHPQQGRSPVPAAVSAAADRKAIAEPSALPPAEAPTSRLSAPAAASVPDDGLALIVAGLLLSGGSLWLLVYLWDQDRREDEGRVTAGWMRERRRLDAARDDRDAA